MMQVANEEHSIDVSLVEAEQVLSRLESRYGLATKAMREPTREFLQGIADWLAGRGLRVTLSGAWQFWRGVFLAVDTLRVRHQRDAEIAFWFKVNPYELTDEQRIGLLANMGRVHAQNLLHTGSYSPTDYEGAYRLTLLATGDKRLADKAKTDALERYIDASIARKKD